MIDMLKNGWRLMSWVETRALGLKPPSTMEDENIMVRNDSTGEQLTYPEYCAKYEKQNNLQFN